MASPTTLTQFPALGVYVNRMALRQAKPYLAYSKFGLKNTIPLNSSKTIKFRRFNKLATSETAPVVEGVPPNSVQMAPTDITITLTQYGNWVEFSDLANWNNEVSVDENAVKTVSLQMTETIENVYRDGLMSGTQFGRLTDDTGTIGAGAMSTVAGAINPKALDKVTRSLEANVADYYEGQVSAGKNIGTVAVRNSYISIVSQDNKYDLDNATLFAAGTYVSAANYGSYDGVLDNEIGAYRNIRFILTQLCKVTLAGGAAIGATGLKGSVNIDVYDVLIFGKDAYTTVNYGAGDATKITRVNATPSVADPLGQKNIVGWKALIGSGILNDGWIYRMSCGAKA